MHQCEAVRTSAPFEYKAVAQTVQIDEVDQVEVKVPEVEQIEAKEQKKLQKNNPNADQLKIEFRIESDS